MKVPQFSIKQGFSSLNHRNFKLWFMGQLASLVGTWMQTTALGFFMYQLNHSPAYLGYIGFAAGLPTLLFTLLGGVVSDRFDRRRLLIITQLAMMCIAGILTVITIAGLVQPWHLLVIAFANGIANAFDAPARQAFVRELVPPEDLTNAIALNSAMFNGALAIGPALAGVIYAAFGPAVCFGINTFSFLAVLVALIMMVIPPHPPQTHTASAIAEVREGVTYILHHSVIRTLLFTVAVSNIFGMGYITILPAWAVNVLHGDSMTLGFLQSARGIGSLLGAFMIASLGRFQFKGKLLTLGSFVYPLFLLLFSFVHWLPLSLVGLIGAGWGFMVLLNLSNALIQTHVKDVFRGRVMSVYSLALMGMMPLGSLLFGTLAEFTTEPFTVSVFSLTASFFALFLLFKFPTIRQLS